MTTTTIPVAITCPDWCAVPAEEHAADLWNQDGDCIHWAAPHLVADATGYRDSVISEPRFWPEIEVRLSSMTAPDGRPTATPIIYLAGHELSVEQAEVAARVLTEQVARARAGQKERQR